MWSFQLTAERNADSFELISQVCSPDILLQARAEKFLSWRYFEAKIRAAKNIRRPHCMDRHAGESSDCSMVKSCLGMQDCIKIK